MKRMLALLMCIIICVGFTGCNQKPAETRDEKSLEERNNEIKAVLTKVLNKEESFTVHNPYIDKTTEENLEKFRFPTYSNALNIFVPFGYMFVDFDADGIDELLIVDANISHFLFLRCDDGPVYGYIPHKTKISAQDIRTDGSFMTFTYDGYQAISRISFHKDTYEITDKAYRNDETGTYLLDGKTASKDEVDAYFNEWDQNTTKASWEEIQ